MLILLWLPPPQMCKEEEGRLMDSQRRKLPLFLFLISSGSFRFCSKIPNPDQYAFGIGKFQISTVVLKFSNEFLWYSYNDTTQSILSWKWYPEQFQKPHNLYKIKLTTSTRSHANKNKHKKDNWFREHFGQNLSSRDTRNGVSEHQDFKIFWGSMPPHPPSGWPLQRSPNSWVIKKKPKIL